MREKAEDTMENLQETGEEIQNRLATYWEAGREKATEYVRTTDRAVRENPYQAIGIALGLGLIVGLILTRGRRSRDDRED
ncbi:MAG: hypothetical protein JWQ04_2995 [Pedosphaera sp.]|nr:hypothetical protein [Pedosphaera sp.]